MALQTITLTIDKNNRLVNPEPDVFINANPEFKKQTDYNNLDNKPFINNVVLSGNITLDDLNIQEKGNFEEIVNKIDNFDNPNNIEYPTTNAVANFVKNITDNIELNTYSKNDIDNKLALKQNSSDTNLNTVDKTIVGAINYLNDNSNKLIDHIKNKNNPHNVTKEQLGLDQIDNTSDKNKPISDLTQQALNNIDNKLIDHIKNKNNPHNVTKEQLGLDQIDNTSDKNKPISDLTQQALNNIDNKLNDINIDLSNKQNKLIAGKNINITNNIIKVVDLNKTDIGLDQIDNTSDIDKPLSKATLSAINDLDNKLSNNISTGDNQLNEKIDNINDKLNEKIEEKIQETTYNSDNIRYLKNRKADKNSFYLTNGQKETGLVVNDNFTTIIKSNNHSNINNENKLSQIIIKENNINLESTLIKEFGSESSSILITPDQIFFNSGDDDTSGSFLYNKYGITLTGRTLNMYDNYIQFQNTLHYPAGNIKSAVNDIPLSTYDISNISEDIVWKDIATNVPATVNSIKSQTRFTNDQPTTVTVGGISAGSTFENKSILNLLYEMLYKEVNPTITKPQIIADIYDGITPNKIYQLGDISEWSASFMYTPGVINPVYDSEGKYILSGANWTNDIYQVDIIGDLANDSIFSESSTTENYIFVPGEPLNNFMTYINMWGEMNQKFKFYYNKGDYDEYSSRGNLITKNTSGIIELTFKIYGGLPYYATSKSISQLHMGSNLISNNISSLIIDLTEESPNKKQVFLLPHIWYEGKQFKIEQYNTFTKTWDEIQGFDYSTPIELTTSNIDIPGTDSKIIVDPLPMESNHRYTPFVWKGDTIGTRKIKIIVSDL